MALKTLQVTLGVLSPQQYQTGWYRDPVTGQYYYYDGAANRWYIYAAGILQPLAVPKQPAPKVVSIAAGDTLRIEYSYKYAGPAVTVTERASIGYTTLGVYDEVVYKTRNRSLSQSSTPKAYSDYFDLVMPTPAQTKWNDIEAKVSRTATDELGVNYQDALNVVAVGPQFSEFSIVDYKKV